MKLYYFKKELNFGDHFNEWMWERLLPGCFDDPNDGIIMTVIGTTIERGVPDDAKAVVIFGSGTSYTPPKDIHSGRWHPVAVRGYMSAKLLGLPESTVAADAAFVLPAFPEATPVDRQKRKGVIFIPHHSTTKTHKWQEICRRAGVEYVDSHIESFPGLEKIKHAELVLTEAMHGAIVSDLVRVPWVPLVGSKEINTFKWMDWLSTINVPFKPTWVPEHSWKVWVRNRLMPLHLKNYYLYPEDPDKVMRLTRRRQALLKNPFVRKGLRLIQPGISLLMHAIQITRLYKLAEAWEERQLAKAVEVFKNAARQPGYLSEDNVVKMRNDLLISRLEDVKRIWEQHRCPRA